MAEELLEKIPPEKRWAITAKTLWRFIVLQGDKIIAPALGKGEDIIAPVLGMEKWAEINEKIFADGGKMFYPWVAETLNIPVENEVNEFVTKLNKVVLKFMMGPEEEYEIIKASRERAVTKKYKCMVWERYEEFEVAPELRPCDVSEEIYLNEGLKAINLKVTCKITKTRPRGDPDCEFIWELKEE
jgi:hypothetical protein